MTISAENITKINRVVENDLNEFTQFMLHSISISSQDDKISIEQKIRTIDSLKNYLLNSINIDLLTSKKEKLFFIKLLSKLSSQKEDLEILIGETNLDSIQKAQKTLRKKTDFAVGIAD